MARSKRLATMSIESLLELRDNITEALSERAEDVRKQLARLTGSDAGNGRRKSLLKGRKVAPKYRSKQNPQLTWAGRGAVPRWMREEMKAAAGVCFKRMIRPHQSKRDITQVHAARLRC